MPDAALPLKNPKLLVEACLIGGEWTKGGSGSIEVTNATPDLAVARKETFGAAGATVPLPRGGRGGPHGQRHGVRSRLLCRRICIKIENANR